MRNGILPVVATAFMFTACYNVPSPSVDWAETIDYPVWKGEKVHARALIKSSTELKGVTLSVKGSKDADAQFIFDVKGDVFADRFDQSGARKKGEYDSIIVADRIGPERVIDMVPQEERPVWVSVRVPADASTGVHKLTLKVKAPGMKTVSLPLSYLVVDETLPAPSEWRFDLDLWQNPYAVARYYGVPLWSDEHFEKMRPLYSRLAQAGQKAVTTTIIDRPWNGQTEDPFGSMVVKTLNADGSWTYDYSVFDKWVEFMFSLGIDKQIKCFTLIPWKLTFDYVDGATGETKYIEGAPGTEAYDGYWTAFLKDFAAHLKEKGWFEKTMLGMDERPREALLACISMVRKAEPAFKTSMAGRFHEDVQKEFHDVCIGATQSFPDSAITYRREKGMICAFYTCCAERYPNVFLASQPKEAAWFGWFALSHNLDGYHRWAYNSWTKDPVQDARFRRWPAGDCYIVYPDATSVRFENLVEGVQDFEKVCILRDRWTAEGNTEKLDSLAKVISVFTMEELGDNGPSDALKVARDFINIPL